MNLPPRNDDQWFSNSNPLLCRHIYGKKPTRNESASYKYCCKGQQELTCTPDRRGSSGSENAEQSGIEAGKSLEQLGAAKRAPENIPRDEFVPGRFTRLGRFRF